MKKLRTLVSVLILSITSFAIGETTVGNGGDLVVCRDSQGQITSSEILDYFEGRELRGLHIDLGSATTEYVHAEKALARLAKISPLRADRYRRMVQEFANNALFKAGIELTDISDSDHDLLPAGCKIEQLAIQRKPVFPEDKLYLVNKDLWDVMSGRDRAGLILHELIYRDSLDEGKQDSRVARYFNSLIASTEFEALSIPDYLKVVTAVFSAKVAASELSAPAGVLCDQNFKTKLIFVVDTSGSNMQTDPSRQRIKDIQSFVRSQSANVHCGWSVISFGEAEAMAHTLDHLLEPTFAPGASIEKSLRSLGTVPDLGGTPYRSAFGMIQELIDRSVLDLSPVRVIFVSDGEPTDVTGTTAVFQMVRDLKQRPNVQFNTVYYGDFSAGAEKLLKEMAAIGQGKFLKANGHIDFGQILF